MRVGIVEKGGAGSGHHGHAGIPGKQGGSLPGNSAFSSGIAASADVSSINKRADAMFIDAANGKQWQKSSKAVRGKLKHKVVTELSTDADLEYEAVDATIHQWAYLANGHSRASLSLQQAAADEFGIELSEWQNSRINELKDNGMWDKKPTWAIGWDVKVNDDGMVLSNTEQRSLLRTMYNNTQASLANHGLTGTVTLYRGVKTDASYEVGSIVDWKGNAIESWSIDPNVANMFGNYTIAMEVPVANILSTPMTGIGALPEGEFVVFGNVPNSKARVLHANKSGTYYTG